MHSESNFSDLELINMLRNGSEAEQTEALGIIYLNHKKYCLAFLRSKFGDREEIVDIYQDAVIILREKVFNPEWKLTAKLQTFLNSVCFYQGLTMFGKSRIKLESNDDAFEISEETNPMEEPLNNERVRIIVQILNDKNKTTEICLEMLKRFWYRNQSLDQIAAAMSYSNPDSVKNQKSRCQAALKKELFRMLNKN